LNVLPGYDFTVFIKQTCQKEQDDESKRNTGKRIIEGQGKDTKNNAEK